MGELKLKVLILGRSEFLYESVVVMESAGHKVVGICTARSAPEYRRGEADFERLALERGIPFLVSSSTKKIVTWLKTNFIHADVAISVNFPTIIGQNVTEILKYGILNAHGGDLPRYRGNACQAWAIVRGESHVAVCVHRMVPDRVDEGDILGRRYFPLLPESKIGDVYRWMEDVIPEMFAETLSELERDPHFILERQSEDPQDSLRCFPRRPEDGRISWNLKPIEIVRLVNASGPPYAGAYCEIDNRRVIVLTASIAQDPTPFLAVPGQVIALTKDSVTVACKEGAVEIQEAQLEDGTALREHIKNIRARLT